MGNETNPQAPTPETPASEAPAQEPTQAAPEPESAPETPAEEPEVTFDDVLADPDLARAAKQRQDAAIADAKAKWEADRKQAEERSKMEETERLSAEKGDLAKENAQLKEQLLNTQLDRDMTSALVEDGVQLSTADSLDFVRFQATKLAAETDMDIKAATRAVIERHPYLVSTPEPSPGGATQEQPAPSGQRTSTVPSKAASPQNQAPTQPEPEDAVDTLGMTPQQYRDYRRSKHGIHH